MTRQSILNLIFNGVGVLLGLGIAGYVVYSLVHTELEPACSTRYPAPTRFSLNTSGGALLSPIELQARVGINEWGMVDNAKVVPAAEAPGGAALEVRLANVPDVETGRERAANGVSFRWHAPGMRSATAVCLSYALWLPNDFAFAAGGLLPGPFGGSTQTAATEGQFAARLQWSRGGDSGLELATAGQGFRVANARAFPLPKGRWARVEQELVLNTPGAADGIARLWLDGELKVEDKEVALRKDKSAAIIGVLADIGYLRTPAKPGMLRLTPFELSWK